MATVAITNLSLCTGGSHVTLTGTVDGAARTVRCTVDELKTVRDDLDLRERLVARMVSAVKEAGATTQAQIRNALVGKTFEV